MEPVIVEIKIGNEQEQVDSLGNKYTSKRYYAKFEDGLALHWEQNVWPNEKIGGWFWHLSEEEWIEEAKKQYKARHQ